VASEPKVAYAWELEKVHCLFHYTYVDHAQRFDHERIYVVSDRPHQKHGHGLFLTTINPLEMSAVDLLKRLFVMQREPENVEAVLVFLRDANVLTIKPAGNRCYVHPAPAGAEIDLETVYLGYGRRVPTGAGWLFSSGLHSVKT